VSQTPLFLRLTVNHEIHSLPAFLFGVMSLTFTCLLYGLNPEWIPFAYTAQSAFYLPSRIFAYKRKSYHYFLFGELRTPSKEN